MAKGTLQVGLRMPAELHERLKKEPGGASEAIRRRLETSLKFEDQYDIATQELSEAVLWMAKQISMHTGLRWCDGDKTRDAVVQAVKTYVAEAKYPEPDYDEDEVVLPEDPAALGRSVAKHFLRRRRTSDQG
jgi:hypothetical protein